MDTGEITESIIKEQTVKYKEPQYIKMYLNVVLKIFGFANKTGAIIAYLLQQMNFKNEVLGKIQVQYE